MKPSNDLGFASRDLAVIHDAEHIQTPLLEDHPNFGISDNVVDPRACKGRFIVFELNFDDLEHSILSYGKRINHPILGVNGLQELCSGLDLKTRQPDSLGAGDF